MRRANEPLLRGWGIAGPGTDNAPSLEPIVQGIRMIASMSASDMLNETIDAPPARTMSTAACSTETLRSLAMPSSDLPARPAAPRPDAMTIDAGPPRRRMFSLTRPRNFSFAASLAIASFRPSLLSPGITAAARLVDEASYGY